jgi:hypothetical protein
MHAVVAVIRALPVGFPVMAATVRSHSLSRLLAKNPLPLSFTALCLEAARSAELAIHPGETGEVRLTGLRVFAERCMVASARPGRGAKDRQLAKQAGHELRLFLSDLEIACTALARANGGPVSLVGAGAQAKLEIARTEQQALARLAADRAVVGELRRASARMSRRDFDPLLREAFLRPRAEAAVETAVKKVEIWPEPPAGALEELVQALAPGVLARSDSQVADAMAPILQRHGVSGLTGIMAISTLFSTADQHFEPAQSLVELGIVSYEATVNA